MFLSGRMDQAGTHEMLKPDMMFTLSRVNGWPETFEVRGLDDAVEFTARRVR